VSHAGFSDRLMTGADLLEKVKHDLERLRHNPGDVYAAFNCLVTAEHLPDWTRRPRGLRGSHPLLRVVSHLANGAKHFEVDHTRHRSVEDVEYIPGAFQAGVFQANAFDVGRLWVSLTSGEGKSLGAWAAGVGAEVTRPAVTEALALGTTKRIDILTLVELVCWFWQREVDGDATPSV
jgi:hypothetical protein